jgi:hypothetical protein
LQSGLIRRLATAAITLTLLSFPAAAQQGALLDVPLASGSERVWFVGPTNPRAVLIMFVGSAGVVEFGANGVTGYEADNFLVRTQPLWLAQGFAVAILGSPNNGALSGHRHELAYADAIGRAVDFVRTRANAPVWLLGISQGAIAVANGAAHLPGKVTGVVLISPLPGAAVRRDRFRRRSRRDRGTGAGHRQSKRWLRGQRTGLCPADRRGTGPRAAQGPDRRAEQSEPGSGVRNADPARLSRDRVRGRPTHLELDQRRAGPLIQAFDKGGLPLIVRAARAGGVHSSVGRAADS